MMSLIDLILSFIPRRCAVCGDMLSRNQEHICSSCRADIPLTNFPYHPDNAMMRHLSNNLPELEGAMALIYYINKSGWRWMIHKAKFRHEWRHALLMGRWFGYELERAGFVGCFDCVIAVPLHPMRQMSRGYNQSDYIAQGIAEVLGTRHRIGLVRRKRNNQSQLSVETVERWANVEDLFEVAKPEQLAGQRVLLVDDVMTTGATILSCGESIVRCVPSVHLWFGTLAVSWQRFGFPNIEKK